MAKDNTNKGVNNIDSSSQQPPVLSTTTNSVDGYASTTAVQQQLKTNTAAIATAARPPLLDVYKKLLIVFKPSDSVVYEDSEGNIKSVPLGDAKLLDTVRLSYHNAFICFVFDFIFSILIFPSNLFSLRNLYMFRNPKSIYRCLKLKLWKIMNVIYLLIFI